MPTFLLRVSGLTGADDERILESALREMDGVYDAVVDHEDGRAEIDADDDVITIDELIEVAWSAGFPARLGG